MVIERFGIYLAPFDPTVGAEMSKTRPCVVLSPNVMNRTVRTVIVAPLTSSRKGFPYRVDCTFAGKDGQVALDQMRSLDRVRFIRRLGTIDDPTASRLTRRLLELFR